MARTTRWETEALRERSRRPRPGVRTVDLRGSDGDADPADPPPGTLLVPLDAWERMLDQLGNLHEAGQQLAEASARAARAETEAEFLRERVADLRRRLAETEAAETSTGSTPSPAPESEQRGSGGTSDHPASEPGMIGSAADLARRAIRDLRNRLR